VVLVAIDEQSLHDLGRWPWPRRTHAELIDRLVSAGARAVALDVAFAEPTEDDEQLAAAMSRAGRVVLPVLHEQVSAQGAPVEGLPVPALSAVAAALGHVDVEVDPDGVVRTAYLEAGMGRPAWPHLTVALLRVGSQASLAVLSGELDPDPSEPAPYFWVRDHRVLVPFAGPPGYFQRLSYVDVLRGQVPDDRLRGAFVLVGPTATGLGDQVPTPVSGFDRPMPGIEFNANLLDALRRGATVQFLALRSTRALTGLVVLLASVGVMFARRQMLVALVSTAAVLALTGVMLVWAGRWFTPTPAVAGILLAYPLAAWLKRLELVADERARADVALGSLAEGVITVGADGRIDYLNAVASNLVGSASKVGSSLGSVLRLAGDIDPLVNLPAAQAFDGAPVDATLVTSSGARLPIRASIVSIGEPNGPHRGLAVALMPKTLSVERPAGEIEAPPPATVEPESGEAVKQAPARAAVEARLAGMLTDADCAGRQVAVLMLGIARLRHVNVAFGRKGGDALLVAVAERLRGAIREPEAVTHMGADEFVVLLNNLPRAEEDVVGLASRLIRVFEAPFTIGGVEVRARAHVGISLVGQHGDDAETLLQRAETAKSWARDHGQEPVQIYAPHMSGPALDRIVLERALQAALEADQLELLYQPQVEIATGAVVSAEALVRWRHPHHGPIPTATFIALAEETELIVGLGEWVLRTGCRCLADWRDRGVRLDRLAVNVSPRQLLEPGLPETIDRTLREFAVDPAMLEIEITENVLVHDLEGTSRALARIKAMGVGVALDDFGVGYSSLEHLSRLPVDCLKIDRSFVNNVAVDGHDRTICLAVLAMASSMRRRVVAEGVETLAQAQFFASKGCDLIQGYYVRPPVRAAEIERLVRDGITFRTA
jgi:diguanylate cyclase (GGDEF)-like protein